jgi:hypothetical protein
MAPEASTSAGECRYAVFAECPTCGGSMAPEHAHYRCVACGWRDSCCD